MKTFEVENHEPSLLPDGEWKLVWYDEFDGTELDRSKWDFRLKRFLLDDIIEEDVLFGRWASGQDILLAADEWSNSLLDSSSNPCYFLWMMECMVKTGYETDWEDLRQKTCNKLLKEEVYGNYQRSEMYAMLYGASTIYSHPGLSDEKKIAFKEHFSRFLFISSKSAADSSS